MLDKKQAKEEMIKLVEDFKSNETSCLAKSYKEAEVRKRYIDTMFKILGWDTDGTIGIPLEEQDVIVEQSIDSEGENKKFIDYTFLIKKKTKFLIEAKKPSESLEKEKHIFQAKSYAFSKRVPFVILTNFFCFRLYDISTKPLINQPNTDLVVEVDLKYTDYIDKFDLLWDFFSKEAVESGSLIALYLDRHGLKRDKSITDYGNIDYAYANIKGSSALDVAFLEDLSNWRLELARDIYGNNPLITVELLSEVVQRTLDRIIFLRILEDRDIEANELLKNVINNYIDNPTECLKYHLDELYKGLNCKYNGLLFTDETQHRDISISDNILTNIIKNLYYPNSPYNFKHIRTEILGMILEEYLGNKLEIENSQVYLRLKPELRKAEGVYYTPEDIVDEITNTTVGALLKNTPLENISQLKILDSACGSGSFLIKAYKLIISWYEEFYNKNTHLINDMKTKDFIYKKDGVPKLTIEAKKSILVNNIFGVDIDAQAIEVTRLSLYISMLEDGYNANARQPILPSLDNNIKCGNSIVDTKFLKYNSANQLDPSVNVFDWKYNFKDILDKGGFDCIIGNPPYIRLQLLEEIYPHEIKKYLINEYSTARYGNFDLYIIFIEKALRLLKENGYLGYIVQNKFFTTLYGEGLRELISSNKHLARVVNFEDKQVFKDVTTYTCLLYLRKTQCDSFELMNVQDINQWRAGNRDTYDIRNEDKLSSKPWYFVNNSIEILENKIASNSVRLGTIAEDVFVGIQTNGDKIYMLKEEYIDASKGLVYCKSDFTKKIHPFEIGHLKKVIKGSVDIKTYFIDSSRKVRLIFPYKIIAGKAILIDKKEYETNYKYTWDYLNECKSTLIARNKGKMTEANWYGYVYRKNLTQFEKEKIVLPSMYFYSTYAYDSLGEYYFIGSGQGGGGGYAIVLSGSNKIYTYYSMLGILNSRVNSFVMRNLNSDRFNNGYRGINKGMVENLYIPKVGDKDKEKIALLLEIEDFTKKIVKLISRLDSAKNQSEYTNIRQLINTFRFNIDERVFELFGLDEEDKAIVFEFLS